MSGIHIDNGNDGKFNATKKRLGKSTEDLTHSKNKLTKKRAIFAQNAKKWKHTSIDEVISRTTARVIKEELSKNDVKNIVSQEMNSSSFEKVVRDIIAKSMEDLYKTLYNRSSSWTSGIKK